MVGWGLYLEPTKDEVRTGTCRVSPDADRQHHREGEHRLGPKPLAGGSVVLIHQNWFGSSPGFTRKSAWMGEVQIRRVGVCQCADLTVRFSSEMGARAVVTRRH
jgi:hypothetical protein